jgi:diguanylate cyclase (GGDEF)-like protein/PAS domain S-box-containing protein
MVNAGSGGITFETAHRRKDGSTFPVEVSSRGDEVDGERMLLSIVRDISERKAAEARLTEANRRFEQALIHAPSGMAIVGLDGSWIEVNDALCRIVGYSHEELLTKTFVDLTHPDDIHVDVAHVQELVLGQRDSYEMEKRYIRKDGSEIWILLTVSVVRDQDGRALHFISQILDIDQRKRAELRLREEADNDALTGLVNRRRLVEIINSVLADAQRHSHTHALLFIDLDGFKAVNDTHGHLFGSRALVEAAAVIRSSARETDVVSRFGGDEFALVLPDTGSEGAFAVGERIRERIAAFKFLSEDKLDIHLTGSVGVATLPDVAASAEELVQAADKAMYAVKDSGKNGIQAAAAPADN